MNTNIKPIPISAAASRLLLQTLEAAKPLTPQARTAAPEDIAEVKQHVINIFDLAASALIARLRQLNANMPMTETVEYTDLLAGLSDIKCDLVGRLEAAEERHL